MLASKSIQEHTVQLNHLDESPWQLYSFGRFSLSGGFLTNCPVR